jgi:TolB-like protein
MRYIVPLIGALVCAPAVHAQGGSVESFDAGLARIAATFARSIDQRTIAIFEFPDLESRITNLGRLVSEQLTTEMVQQSQGRASVVERRQVIQILTELNLLNTDLTASQVARVGRQLGADAIILGSATLLGSQVIVNARLVDVSAGRVLAADRMSIVGSEPLLAMASQGMNAPTMTPSLRPGSAPPSPVVTRPSQRVGIDEVSVELVGCAGRGTSVVCEFKFHNEGPDRELGLTSNEHTRLIDDSGTEYRSAAIELAGDRRLNFVEKTLVAGVVTPGRVTYSPVAETVQMIALLEVRAGKFGGWRTLQFRNVPVSR